MRFSSVPLIALTALAVSTAVSPADDSALKTLRKVLSSPLVDEGSEPDGCTPAVNGFGGPSAWEVRLERLLLDGKALVESTKQAVQYRFPLCISDLPLAKNAEVALPFVLHDGGMARVAGIVLRFADPQDFYAVEADAIEGRVRFLRIVNGVRREITSRAAELFVGRAQTLGIRANDDSFGVSLDGRALFEVRDRAIMEAGRFGIWSRSDSLTSFGDLFITTQD
jgi:hypothetical protein